MSQNNTLANVCRAKDELYNSIFESKLNSLPTDEEIEKKATIWADESSTEYGFISGAKWMKDQIGGEKC